MSKSTFPLRLNCQDSLKPVISALNDIKTWMDLNFLSFNDGNSEITLFGVKDIRSKVWMSPLTVVDWHPVCVRIDFKILMFGPSNDPKIYLVDLTLTVHPLEP